MLGSKMFREREDARYIWFYLFNQHIFSIHYGPCTMSSIGDPTTNKTKKFSPQNINFYGEKIPKMYYSLMLQKKLFHKGGNGG